jgi:hypothetical protein
LYVHSSSRSSEVDDPSPVIHLFIESSVIKPLLGARVTPRSASDDYGDSRVGGYPRSK